MPALRNYDLFISHAWKYGDAYDRLEGLLLRAPNFQFRNYSVPSGDGVADPTKMIPENALTTLLDRQIRPAQCVLVIAGMYAAHRYWMDKEIAFAQMYQKPIIGLVPWGQERVPESVQTAAHEMVGWNTDSIVSANRRWSL